MKKNRPFIPVEPQATRAPRAMRPRRELNWPLAVGTLIALLVLVPSAWGWHAFQVYRQSQYLFRRAETLQQSGDARRALDLLYRYLLLNPQDATARVQFAWVFDKAAETPSQKNEALEHFARAIGLFPDDLDLQLRYAELLLETGNSVSASQTAQTVVNRQRKNARALRILAMANLDIEQTQARTSPSSAVRSICEQAIETNPQDITLAVRYADYLRAFPSSPERKQNERFADSIIDRMVDNNPDNVEAYIARYLYRQRYNLPNADVDLTFALSKFPDHPSVLVLEADRMFRNGKTQEAVETYRRVIARDATQRAAYLGLANVYRRMHDYAAARAVIQEGLAAVGSNDFSLQLDLAQTLIIEGAAGQAEDVVQRLYRFFASVAPQLAPRTRVELEIVLAVLAGDLERSRGNLRGAAQQYEFALRRFSTGGGDLRQYQQQIAVLTSLAQIYFQLAEYDRAAGMYRRLAALEPADYRWRLGIAEAQRRAGQWVDAVDAYRTALRLQGCPAKAWFELARLLVRVESAKPAVDRNWVLFQEAFQQVQNTLGEGFYTRVLQAEFLLAQNDPINGLDALRQAEELADKVGPEDRMVLAELYRRTGQTEKLNRLIQSAPAPSEPAGFQALLLQVESLWRAAKYDAARATLQNSLSSLPTKEQQARVLAALAQLEISIGDAKSAEQALAQAEQLGSNSLDPLEVRAALLRSRKQWTEHAQVIDTLRRLEGPDGCLWREAEAWQYLLREPAAPNFREAQRLVEEIRTLRPTWPRGYLLAAAIAEMRNRPREASDHLEAALRYGDQQPSTYEKLIRLLTLQHRLTEAYQYAERYANQWPNLHESARDLAASLRAESADQAIAEARENLQNNPGEWLAYERLGTLLLFAGKAEEAKTIYEEGVRKFPDEAQLHLGLFAALVTTGDKQTAEQTLTHIASHNLLPPDKLHLTLAQGYELLGKIDEAELHYLEALRQTPYDRTTLRLAVRFFSRLDLDRAQRALETSLQLTDNAAAARRALAAVLAAKGGEENWRRAIELLENTGGQDAVSSAANLRLQAVLYARRGSVQNRREAIRILEQLVQSPSQAAVGDYLLLYSLYKEAGELDKAEAHLRGALALEPSNPNLRVMLLEFHVEQNQLDRAEELWQSFDESLRTSPVVVGLTARLRHQQGKAQEAEQLLAGLVERGTQELDATRKRVILETAAYGYERLGMLEKAEHVYRLLVEQPGMSRRNLIAFLLRSNRSNEALQVALTQSSQVMAREDFVLLCSLVSFADPLEEYRERVNQVIADGLIRWGDDPQVLFAVATLSYMRGQVQQAATLMGRLLEKTPTDIAALNNMALFQAELPDQKEQALQTINRAIDLVGPQPNLVDTLGLVQMALDRLDQAERSFQEAIAQSRQPSYYLHLAEAQRRAGKHELAIATYREALRLGLHKQPLHLNDQQMARELQRLLQQ